MEKEHRTLVEDHQKTYSKKKLPDFLIIGAQKSGTTWLVDMLRDHSDIYISRSEVHYFNENYDKGIDWYTARFGDTGEASILGEKTPDYLGGDLHAEGGPYIAQRIYELLPEAKLIVVLRDPVSRAVSAYNHYVRTRKISPLQNINSYFLQATYEQDSLGIVSYGRYEKSLSAYEELFDSSQMLILYYEDMMEQKQKTLDEVCSFIGSAKMNFPNLEVRSNAYRKSRLGLMIHYYLPALKRLGWQFDKILPTDKQQVNDEVRDFLNRYYAPTLNAMENKLGYLPKKWKH